jgi:hypothetical protein
MNHEPDEQGKARPAEQGEADPQDRPGNRQVLAADQRARQVAEVRLVGRLQAVDLGDDVQDGGDDEQDAHEAERGWIVIGIPDQLHHERPEQDDRGERGGDRQADLQVQVGHQEDHAQPERHDDQGIPEQDIRQPPHVASEPQGQGPKEAQDVRTGEVQDEGEGPQDRQDGGDRQDEPSRRSGGQGGGEIVGVHRSLPWTGGSIGRRWLVPRRL